MISKSASLLQSPLLLRSLLLIFTSLIQLTTVYADSPLTSIDLASAYSDLEIVQTAREAKSLAQVDVLQFLVSDAPNDQKAAVINALGWRTPQGESNAEIFLKSLLKRGDHHFERVMRGESTQEQALSLSKLNPSERFVLGYLLAMRHYLDLRPLRPRGLGVWGASPLALLKSAANDAPQDFTIQYITALVQAQEAMKSDWCQVYRGPHAVLKRFRAKRRTLRKGSIRNAQAYLKLYRKECSDSPDAKRELDQGFNQVYSLRLFGDQLIAGTQSGVVIWNTQYHRPLAHKPGFICNSITVTVNEAFIGCDARVYRWDGRKFREHLKNRDGDGVYYQLVQDQSGAVWASYKKRGWRWDAERGRFKKSKLPYDPSSYNIIIARDGALWDVRFMSEVRRSLDSTVTRFPIMSALYPGRDPRDVREDLEGRIWIVDFGTGLYRFNPERGLFIHEPGLTEKGSGVAYNPKSQELWQLHYTRGLTKTIKGRVIERFELGELENMRDLLLDPRDESLWVAGWNQIVHLRRGSQAGATWTRKRLIFGTTTAQPEPIKPSRAQHAEYD